MFADVFRGQAAQMRHLGLELPVDTIETPCQARNPAEATFDQHQFQPWATFEYALDDHAGQQRLAGLRVPHHFLDVEGRPATTGDGVSAITERMYGDRQPK